MVRNEDHQPGFSCVSARLYKHPDLCSAETKDRRIVSSRHSLSWMLKLRRHFVPHLPIAGLVSHVSQLQGSDVNTSRGEVRLCRRKSLCDLCAAVLRTLSWLKWPQGFIAFQLKIDVQPHGLLYDLAPYFLAVLLFSCLA